MRFLADENCDFAVIRVLRADGHDVLSVSDISPRAEDSEVRGWSHVVGHSKVAL